MSTGGRSCNCILAISGISRLLGICHQKPHILCHLTIIVTIAICDEKAMGMGLAREDSPTNEGVFSMRFDVFLESDDMVAELLEG